MGSAAGRCGGAGRVGGGGAAGCSGFGGGGGGCVGAGGSGCINSCDSMGEAAGGRVEVREGSYIEGERRSKVDT